MMEDLEKQWPKVSPPSSPKQSEFLTGLMKSLDKQHAKAAAKLTLDEDPLFLPSTVEQAKDKTAIDEGHQRAGDISGRGGSMSLPHGSSSSIPPDVALQAIRQPAADLIRGGRFSLPLPLPSEAEGIDLCALLQVRSPRTDDMQSSSVSVEY